MKKLIKYLSPILFILVILWPLRLFFFSKDFYEKGVKQEEKGNYARAALWYADSAKAYFPFNPYVTRSHDALDRLSREMENRGRIREALNTARELSASIAAVRSFYQPFPEKRENVSERIAGLKKKPAKNGRNSVADEKHRRHAE